MIEPLVAQLKRIEAAIARQTAQLHSLVMPPPKHGAGVPPWHMWGGGAVAQCEVTTGGVQTQSVAGQFANVNYKRPESWNFLFAAKLLSGADSLAAQIQQVNVQFNLTVGIGRSTIILPNFESLSFVWGPLQAAPVGQLIWSTEVIAPPRAPADTRENICDHITAQTIQLDVVVLYQSTVANRCAVEIQAQFAPQVHVRPEWHLHQFPGGEE